MNRKRATEICFVAIAILLVPILGCGKKETGANREDERAGLNTTIPQERVLVEESEKLIKEETAESPQVQATAETKAAATDPTPLERTDSASANKTEAKRAEQRTETPRVTFIELGSVKCIPCKMMQPIMREIAEEYSDQVKVVFHDVWTHEGKPYARKYRIRVIPTQVFLDKDGNEYFRHQGFFAKDELVKVLKMQGVE